MQQQPASPAMQVPLGRDVDGQVAVALSSLGSKEQGDQPPCQQSLLWGLNRLLRSSLFRGYLWFPAKK